MRKGRKRRRKRVKPAGPVGTVLVAAVTLPVIGVPFGTASTASHYPVAFEVPMTGHELPHSAEGDYTMPPQQSPYSNGSVVTIPASSFLPMPSGGSATVTLGWPA